MQPPSGPPSRVADILGTVLKRVDRDQQMHAYSVWTFWDAEVGDGIARRAQPTHFRNGILFVTVATHSWMQELQFMKEMIAEKLNQRLKSEVVKTIFFMVGRIDAPEMKSDDPQTVEPAAPPSGSDEFLQSIDDPEIRDAFRKLLKSFARRKRKA